MVAPAPGLNARPWTKIKDVWPLWFGFLILAIPTVMRLAKQTWTKDFGAYGPIVLATGAWLVWRQADDFRRTASAGKAWLTALVITVSLAGYVFGRAYDFLTLETAGVYGVGLAMIYSRFGLTPMRANWFPLLYLAFLIPPPGTFLADVTGPLKHFVSWAATSWLDAWGVPVAREGVTIFVAQYQLLVEDACSGMNSLVGLIAVSLLYIYLMRGSTWRYSVALLCFVIPIAVAANVMRIMILILLTYFFGDEVAQGFLHFTAGMVLFATALLFVFGVDTLLYELGKRLRRPQ